MEIEPRLLLWRQVAPGNDILKDVARLLLGPASVSEKLALGATINI